jgi:HD domain
VQVIIVKLADRLHNMRTIWALPADKARAVTRETLDVWCPMCEWLGLSAVKGELEDLAFAALDPFAFRALHARREEMLRPAVRRRATPGFLELRFVSAPPASAMLRCRPGHILFSLLLCGWAAPVERGGPRPCG